MPWREVCSMDERMRLMAALSAAEESVTELCEDFGISRKTAYKWWGRYLELGPEGLKERSYAPAVVPWAISEAQAEAIVGLRRAHPSWGPKKLRARLSQSAPSQSWPAPSTIGELLRRQQLSQPRKRRKSARPSPIPLRTALAPNDLWCTDFKGPFHTDDGVRCDPLTLTDAYSRYLLCVKAVAKAGYADCRSEPGAGVSGIRPAARDSLGQRSAVRFGRSHWTYPAVGVVVKAGHHAGANRAGQARAERAA